MTWMLKNSRGKPDAMLTMGAAALVVVLVRVAFAGLTVFGYAIDHRGTRVEETDKKTTTSSSSSSSSSTAAIQERRETTSAGQAREVRHVDLSTQATANGSTASNSTTTEEHKRVEEPASSALSLVERLQWDPLHFKPQQPEWIAGLEYKVFGPLGVYANVGQRYRDDSGALDFQVRAGLQLKLDLL